MPIVLCVGQNTEQKQQKFVGIHDVLEHLAQDRYLSVKLRGGRHVCGGRIMAVNESDLHKLGIDSDLPLCPVHIVMHCTPQNEEKTALVSDFRPIEWHKIEEIFMSEWSAHDLNAECRPWTYEDLFEHFRKR